MDKDYTLENSSEDQKEEIGTQLESFMPFDMPFKIKRPHTGWAFFKKIIYGFPWSEEGRRHGRKVGRDVTLPWFHGRTTRGTRRNTDARAPYPEISI